MLLKKKLVLEHKIFFRYKKDRALRCICNSCESFPTTITAICPGCYKVERLSPHNSLQEYTYNKYQLSF